MRALVVHNGQIRLVERPTPTLKPGEALIAIRLAGICNTDLEILAGYMQFSGVLGHEFVGEVVDCPSEPGLVGRRVVGEINVSCGDCDFCYRGIPSQCRRRTTVGIDRHDGAFADFLALDARLLHVVPDTVSDQQAVFVEPLAAAAQALELSHVRSTERVVVIGAGKLGLLCAQVVRLTGAEVVVVVRRPRTRALVEQWGLIPATSEQLDAASFQVAIECTGNNAGFDEALRLLEPRGRLLLKSTYVGQPPLNMTMVVVNELSLIGSRCGPFDTALRLLDQRLVDVETVIDAQYALSDGSQALIRAADPGRLKVLLTPGN